MTQKDIALELDHAAMKAGPLGASCKQTWLLAGLMLKAGADPKDEGLSIDQTNASLTTKKASSMIARDRRYTAQGVKQAGEEMDARKDAIAARMEALGIRPKGGKR